MSAPPPPIALMRLILDAPDADAARAAAPEAVAERISDEVFARVRRVADALRPPPGPVRAHAIAEIAARFDAAAAISPDAAAALYSLGDATQTATMAVEVARWLRDEALLRQGLRVLEVGCGPGRFLLELAEAQLVVGVEISAVLAREAASRLRTAGRHDAVVLLGDGRGTGFARAGVFDLVLYADSFPYVAQAGLAQAHLCDAARALTPAGRLVVLNWNYRASLEEQEAEARALGAAAGLTLERVTHGAFTLWNATAYVFARAAPTP